MKVTSPERHAAFWFISFSEWALRAKKDWNNYSSMVCHGVPWCVGRRAGRPEGPWIIQHCAHSGSFRARDDPHTFSILQTLCPSVQRERPGPVSQRVHLLHIALHSLSLFFFLCLGAGSGRAAEWISSGMTTARWHLSLFSIHPFSSLCRSTSARGHRPQQGHTHTHTVDSHNIRLNVRQCPNPCL